MITRQILALVLALALSSPRPSLTAQESSEQPTPRAISDSTYAARIFVDALAESIRRGQLDVRQVNDPAVAAAVATLATASAAHGRRPPRADLGILWDVRVEVAEFRPEGRDTLRVMARVFLATVGDSAATPVALVLGRRGDRWDLVAHEGLVARLGALARGFRSGGRR
jgi:hypothetical protein